MRRCVRTSRLTGGTLFLALWIACASLAAQQPSGGSLEGDVTDSSGAVIPGAAVTILAAGMPPRNLLTGPTGHFQALALPSSRLTVRASSPGFATWEDPAVLIPPGRTLTLAITLEMAVEHQRITVNDNLPPGVSPDPTSNASAIVLGSAQLAAFSDDPAELAQQLQTLAGSGGGTGSSQLFVDGFTASRLPPKSAILEVRINQNPLSAEFDRLGYGRIEILTKPGTDKLRGEAYFDLSDSAFSTRNPFLSAPAPFQQRLYGFSLGGPLHRRASFFFDFERQEIDDAAAVNATILDPITLTPATLNQTVSTPSRSTNLSPRVDYQWSPAVTLSARYRFNRVTQSNAGVGTLSLPSRAYATSLDEQLGQLSATTVLSSRAINETRFQFVSLANRQDGDNSTPALDVPGAFSGGGNQLGLASSLRHRWELQNYSTFAAGAHTLRFGLRLRGASVQDTSPQNFGGTFTFDSLDRYRQTLLLARQGLSPAEIAALGYGASQFTLSAGDPAASVRQLDLGAFLQYDWRARPNFTLSLGLRYETQTNLGTHHDFAPRLGFAWSPGADPNKRKTVLRGGFGLFYDRLSESLTLQTLRFNGQSERQYIVANPTFFPTVPTAADLAAAQSPTALWRTSPDARTPYLVQGTFSLERQLPAHSTLASTLLWSEGHHTLLARAAAANVYQYETSGVYRQFAWNTSGNLNLGKRGALFGMYGYVVTHSNTDGPSAFPANSANLAADYGRSLFDMRHHFEAGGSFTLPHGIRLSPLFNGRSGMPFNLTTGSDLNGDGLFTDRPAFAAALRPGVLATPYGLLDPNPPAGAAPIPRNFGQGPAYVILNLRISRSFSFGSRGGASAKSAQSSYQAVFADAPGEKRYSLTISASAHNLMNSVNAANPVGVVTSPLFLQSRALGNYWGPAGEAANRRINLQLRFSF